MKISRKQFLAAAAISSAASLAAATTESSSPVKNGAAERKCASAGPGFHPPVLKPGQFDQSAMQATLSATWPHKQVFQTSELSELMPGKSSLYFHMQASLNAFQFSFNLGPKGLGVLAVLMGRGVLLAVDDAMWSKYELAKNLNLHPICHEQGNPYYHASGPLEGNAGADAPNGLYQQATGEALTRRGARFWVCHNALSGTAAGVAKRHGSTAAQVLADFKAHLLPGFQWVPAGVAGVQLAQDAGWKLFEV